jgi:hypothetical protein
VLARQGRGTRPATSLPFYSPAAVQLAQTSSAGLNNRACILNPAALLHHPIGKENLAVPQLAQNASCSQ